MKTLNVNGREFQYELFWHSSEYGTSEWTEFYEGTITETRKKYWFFGKEIKVTKPYKVFTIWKNIESKDYTKKQIRALIEHEVEKLDRKKEIENGEII